MPKTRLNVPCLVARLKRTVSSAARKRRSPKRPNSAGPRKNATTTTLAKVSRLLAKRSAPWMPE
jgi:hypothetical protein